MMHIKITSIARISYMTTIKQLILSMIIATSATNAWCMEDETSLLTAAKRQILLDKCTKIINTDAHSVAYHPQEKQLATGSKYDGTITLWNTDTWKSTNVLSEHTEEITTVIYHPLLHQLASGSKDNTIKLWNPETGQCVATLTDHTYEIFSLSYHPERMELVSRSDDDTLKIWDVRNNQCIHSFEDIGTFGHKSVVHHPNGEQIAVTTNYGTGIKECELKELLSNSHGDLDFVKSNREHNPNPGHMITALTYNKDGSQLAFGSQETGYVGIIQKNGKTIKLRVPARTVTAIAFHPSENKISAGNFASGTIQTWNTENLIEYPELFFDTKYSAYSLAYNPQGTQLAVGAMVGQLHILNTKLLNNMNKALSYANNLVTGFEKLASKKLQQLSSEEKEQLTDLGFNL